jgi:site-specific recombinase XerD
MSKISTSILSLAIKSNFQGIYKKQTKKGLAFIARYTVNKKTRTQIIGYMETGMTEYEAYKERLNLIASNQLLVATESVRSDEYNLALLFNRFILDTSCNLAENTKSNYKSIYNQYINKDFSEADIRNVTAIDLQRYINNTLEYRRPSTVDKIVYALKKFYRYLQDRGIYRYNSASNLEIPKYDNKKYFSMSKRDLRRVINYIKNIESHLFKTFYYILLHGRRWNESMQLKWSDIDFPNKVYKLSYENTKTKQNQFYYLEEFQLAALKKLKEMNNSAVFVFENPKTKKPYSYTTFFKIHKKLRIDLNLEDYIIHHLRHTVAFLIINNGYSLEITGKVLGHKSLTSTERYANLEMKKAKEAYGKTLGVYF